MIDLDSIKSLGPLPVTIIVCYFFGLLISKSPLQNRYIPVLVAVLGSVLYANITPEADANVRNPTLFNYMIGFVGGASSTWADQLFRQTAWGRAWLKLIGELPKETTTENNEKSTPPTPPPVG